MQTTKIYDQGEGRYEMSIETLGQEVSCYLIDIGGIKFMGKGFARMTNGKLPEVSIDNLPLEFRTKIKDIQEELMCVTESIAATEINRKINDVFKINLVTCGSCGDILKHEYPNALEELTCPHCGFNSDISDFPDLFY